MPVNCKLQNLISLILFLYFLLIIKSKPRSVFLESISFLKIPFLNILKIVTIDSNKREIIENIRIIKLLVKEMFLFGCRFLSAFFFISIRSVMG